MTDAKRQAAVLAVIDGYTKKHGGDQASARKVLIEEGIYTKGGNLRKEFGGAGKKERATA